MEENDRWNPKTNVLSARVKYQGNVLRCDMHRSSRQNLEACRRALAILLDITPEELDRIWATLATEEGLTVEYYRSHGA